MVCRSHDSDWPCLYNVSIQHYLYELQTNWNQFFITTNDSTINKIINIDGENNAPVMRQRSKANHILFRLGQKQMEYALGK